MTAEHASPATLHYGDGEFAVLKPGGFVRCSVTAQAIPLTALRYWSVERQEAYLSPKEFMMAAGLWPEPATPAA